MARRAAQNAFYKSSVDARAFYTSSMDERAFTGILLLKELSLVFYGFKSFNTSTGFLSI